MFSIVLLTSVISPELSAFTRRSCKTNEVEANRRAVAKHIFIFLDANFLNSLEGSSSSMVKRSPAIESGRSVLVKMD